MRKYIEALETLDFARIQEAACKEASRQVGEMTRWLKWKPEHDPDGFESLSYLVEPIEAAKRYRYQIYNRGKEIKPIVKRITELEEALLKGQVIDNDELVKLRTQKTEKETAQYTEAIKVLRVYCIVISRTSLIPPVGSEEVAEKEMYYEA